MPALKADKMSGFGQGAWKPGILVGDRMVGVFDAYAAGGLEKTVQVEGKGRNNIQFGVSSITDGKMLSGKDDNWLEVVAERGVAEVVPQAQRFISDTLNGHHLGGGDSGLPRRFGFGGLFAHGNRLLIPSVTHLYCIGDPAEPYNGKPGP